MSVLTFIHLIAFCRHSLSGQMYAPLPFFRPVVSNIISSSAVLMTLIISFLGFISSTAYALTHRNLFICHNLLSSINSPRNISVSSDSLHHCSHHLRHSIHHLRTRSHNQRNRRLLSPVFTLDIDLKSCQSCCQSCIRPSLPIARDNW